MRRIMCLVTLIALAIGTGGCFIATGNSAHCKSPDVPCGTIADDGSAIAEIDAAAKLFSDADKTDVFKDIARRRDLGGKSQAHLVKTAMRSIFSDSSKEEVLLAVIENPCFNNAGKKAVLANLNHIFSDSRKKRILKAINNRQMQSPPVEVEVTVEAAAQTSVN
ncbi:MAG: hypothetical protein ACOYLD_08620 [Anaerohalosphaeraceae bacterium]|nr:hypothetical protein [Anaerohalosphaeraceae bacterium]